jgi:hypothetical protein
VEIVLDIDADGVDDSGACGDGFHFPAV